MNLINKKTIHSITYQFFINDVEKNKINYRHKNNRISTTKYNLFTFLPKALLFQFMRLANVYFLIIAVIQSISIISPLGKETAWGPLAIVLTVSLIREAFEDYCRYVYDNSLNNEPVVIYRNGEWIQVKSGDLSIGEIVLVTEEMTLPSDMLLLDSNAEEGVAFIETASLDGEKTLKRKISPKETSGFFSSQGILKKKFGISGECFCDSPNPELYKLDCRCQIFISDNNTESERQTNSIFFPADAKQLLLKGSILKNTKWVIGFVLYTGHNNKLILNSKKPRMKYSTIEFLMSKLLVFILIIQTVFCAICAALNRGFYYENVVNNPNLPKYIYNDIIDPLLNYFTYMLLLNTMIPISLIISLEMAKIVQAYFIVRDVEGYSHVRKQFIKASTVSLNEELGQVNFIFSDKTGTLTCNKMEYKYGVIGDVCYEYIRENKQQDEKEENLRLNEEEKDIIKFGKEFFSPNKFNLNGGSKYHSLKICSDRNPEVYYNMEEEKNFVSEYWKALAICHQCEIEEKDNGDSDILGLSPDDIELVKTAASQGYECKKSPSATIRHVVFGGIEKNIELLHTLEFDSTRKRMSVIIKDGDIIKLYIKGADTAIEWIDYEKGIKRISSKSNDIFMTQAKYYVDYFSKKGFRTLLVGMKVLDQAEFDEFKENLNLANMKSPAAEKQKAIDDVYAQVENNIYLIGATIVEDKLQDKVPETIRDLRLAGIKIWMLTGDKIDTAYNIGLSCNLISKDIKNFRLHGEKGDKLYKLVAEFNDFTKKKSNENLPYSIIIDAVALSLILETEEYTKLFLMIAYDANSVICCRVSPLQKSEVVRIIKKYNKNAVTLSIGDGGNDVSMINEAHIGVGMYGEEGQRAVQSGDYAIGEFKFLHRLLFFHGRINNIRISKMILYFFYKNFVFTIVHFYYGFFNNFSGQSIYDDWFITFYNLIFTAFPLGVLSVSDFDVKVEDGIIIKKLLPFLYRENLNSPVFTKSAFFFSLLRGLIHGIINFIFIIYTLGISSSNGDGDIADLWFLSVALYTNIIIIVSVQIIIIVDYHTVFNWIIMSIFSWGVYILFLCVMQNGIIFNSVGTMIVAFKSGKLWLTFLIVVGTCGFIDIFTKSFEFIFKKNLTQQLMILVNKQSSLNNNIDLNDNIKNLLMQCEYSSSNDEEIQANVVHINHRNAIDSKFNPKTNINLNPVELDKIDGYAINNFSVDENSNYKDELQNKKNWKPNLVTEALQLHDK